VQRECLCRSSGTEAALHAEGTLPSRERAFGIWLEFLKSLGVPVDQLELNDASGLSRSNLVTPRSVTALLSAAARAPWREEVDACSARRRP